VFFFFFLEMLSSPYRAGCESKNIGAAAPAMPAVPTGRKMDEFVGTGTWNRRENGLTFPNGTGCLPPTVLNRNKGDVMAYALLRLSKCACVFSIINEMTIKKN
jgi:hypothetical protein